MGLFIRSKPVKYPRGYALWALRHRFCAACHIPHEVASRRFGFQLTTHHIVKSGRSDEPCVTGDTRIQTRDGCPRIESVAGVPIEVWNGFRWSKVFPTLTAKIAQVFAVALSDGSVIRVTANHAWPVRPTRKCFERRLRTDQLPAGGIVRPFSLGEISGVKADYPFEHGYAAGDGYIDTVHGNLVPMACVCGDKENLDLSGVWYKPQVRDGKPYQRISLRGIVSVEVMTALRDQDAGLPELVFSWDRDSVLQFVAGWIESDGTVVRNEQSDGYRIYTTEPKARELQLLLRRVGINAASVRKTVDAGQLTNKGVRKRAMWHVQIPSYECGGIPTRRKRASRIAAIERPCFNRIVAGVRNQSVVSIEPCGYEPVYCVGESETGMAVFGNVLTYQCNLLRLCWRCHQCAENIPLLTAGVRFPILPLGVCLWLKWETDPTEFDLDRIKILLHRNPPDLEPPDPVFLTARADWTPQTG